jgi:hypothetical protein
MNKGSLVSFHPRSPEIYGPALSWRMSTSRGTWSVHSWCRRHQCASHPAASCSGTCTSLPTGWSFHGRTPRCGRRPRCRVGPWCWSSMASYTPISTWLHRQMVQVHVLGVRALHAAAQPAAPRPLAQVDLRLIICQTQVWSVGGAINKTSYSGK